MVTARRTRTRAVRKASGRRRWRPARRAFLALLAAPLAIRVVVATLAVPGLWSGVNVLYQVIRKPTELFFPVSGALSKPPAETWREYAPVFREHATVVITPDLLAAPAQIEGAGNQWPGRTSGGADVLGRPPTAANL